MSRLIARRAPALGPRSFVLAALLALVASGAVAAPLWVASGPAGHALEAARDAGVAVRGALPDAVVVDDAAAARTLARAGFRVSGPIEAPETGALLMARAVDSRSADPTPLTAAGVRILWRDGAEALLAADVPELPQAARGIWRIEALGSEPLPVRVATALRAPLPTTTFSPLVDAAVAQVDATDTFFWVESLAGAIPAVVGGADHTIPTRYSYSEECDLAEQYVHERFEAMGFTDVVYDPFPIGSTQCRNVIATLPGLTTPEHQVIVCGHLDSTSGQAWSNAPGANDNASGTAVVLAAAEILSQYTFHSTIKFIAFTGEEQGLYGSNHYAAGAFYRGDLIDGVLNADMVSWWNSQWAVLVESKTFAEPLVTLVRDACAEYTGLATSVSWTAWGSDHAPFLNRQIPAILAIEQEWSSDACYHSTCDLAARQDPAFLAEVARAIVASAAQLAGITDATAAPELAGLAGDGLRLSVAPNPAPDATTIAWALDAPGRVRLSVHDAGGRLVRTLADGRRPAGPGAASWDGRTEQGAPAAGGVYFVRLRTDAGTETARVVRPR